MDNFEYGQIYYFLMCLMKFVHMQGIANIANAKICMSIFTFSLHFLFTNESIPHIEDEVQQTSTKETLQKAVTI